MQTKLSDKGTQLLETNETTTSSLSNTKPSLNHLLDENASSHFDDSTTTNTPKSKRIKFTFESTSKFVVAKINNTNQNEYDLIDLTNDSPEKLEYPSEDGVNDEENTAVNAPYQQIDSNLDSKSLINLPTTISDTSSKALQELDSNDESLNRKKSLRTQIRINTTTSSQQLIKQSAASQPAKTKFKKHQSATIISSTSSSLTKNLMTTNNNSNNTNSNSNNNNTFACLRNLGSTCYINCIIQVMRYTPGFVNSIHRLNKQIDYLEHSLNAEIESEINSNNNVKFVKNLHQLLEEMSEKEKQDRRPIYSPSKFVKTVWTLLSFWSNGSQQDAHEYTIHFINECDLFIRKIHQQYHLKQMPYLDDTTKTSVSDQTISNISTTQQQQPPKTRQTKNSLKSANDLIAPTKQLINEQPQVVKIDRRKKEFRNKENLINHKDASSCVNKLQIVNQNLSDRLIKSIPKIESTSPSATQMSSSLSSTSEMSSLQKKDSTDLETNNFMRTPTKGGSSLHLAIINSEDTIQSESDLVEPFGNDEIINNKKVKLIDDKDLVSMCLKERLSNDYKSTSHISSSTTNDSTTSNNKMKNHFKRETNTSSKNTKENLISNDNINSIIIIDSDSDDDYDQEMVHEQDECMEITENSNRDNKNFNEDYNDVDDDDEQENININKAQTTTSTKTSNDSFKKVVVSVEKLNIDRLLNKNNLKLSKDTKDYLDDENKLQKQEIGENHQMFKQETSIKPTQFVQKEQQQPQRSTRSNLKKLTSKAKTFPDLNSANDNNLTDLDAITILNQITCTKPMSLDSSNNSKSLLKSKLRTNVQQVTYDTNSSKSPFLLASNLMNKINESSPARLQIADCKLPTTSPAELLRRYSINNGYTCEMDKIFKGSSITVTQCLECENLRKLPEEFYDRSIPLDTTTNQSECLLNENNNSNDPNDETVNWISKCLQNESYLNDNSKYMCDKCSSKQEAKIHTQYTHMPNILILHLLSYGITSSVDGNLNAQKLSNRSRLLNYFDYICCSNAPNKSRTNSNSTSSSPLTTRTSLKRQRTTTNQLNDLKHQFKLYAVVMHSGTTLNSGHYTAYVNYKIISKTTTTTPQRFNKEKLCSCFLNTNLNVGNSATTTNLITTTTTTMTTTTKLNEFEWLHFDDTKVKSLSNLEFHRKIIDSNYDSPYILFYVKE